MECSRNCSQVTFTGRGECLRCFFLAFLCLPRPSSELHEPLLGTGDGERAPACGESERDRDWNKPYCTLNKGVRTGSRMRGLFNFDIRFVIGHYNSRLSDINFESNRPSKKKVQNGSHFFNSDCRFVFYGHRKTQISTLKAIGLVTRKFKMAASFFNSDNRIMFSDHKDP